MYLDIYIKCRSIKELPNISEWEISNNKDIALMIGEFLLLESLPAISNWNTNNIEIFGGLFKGCLSL